MSLISTRIREKFYGYEVILDSRSQLDIVHPRFLKNIRKESSSFKGAEKNFEVISNKPDGAPGGFL